MAADIFFLKQIMIVCFSLLGILFLMIGIISIFFIQPVDDSIRSLGSVFLLGGINILSQIGRIFSPVFSHYPFGENLVMLFCFIFLYRELLRKIDPNLDIRKYNLFSYISPFFLVIIWSAILTVYDSGYPIQFPEEFFFWPGHLEVLFRQALYLMIFSGIIFMSVYAFLKYQRIKKEQEPDIEPEPDDTRLFRTGAVAYGIYGIFFCISLLQENLSVNLGLCLLYTCIPFISAKYSGFYFKKAGLYNHPVYDSINEINEICVENNPICDSFDEEYQEEFNKSYAGYQGINIRHLSRLVNLKENFMDLLENKKIYLDPELTLEKVAQLLHTNKTYLSKLINHELKKNFYQVLNEYRIRNAMEMMKEPDSHKVTIKYISEESGFKSISSFNKSFKQINGISPREWVQSHIHQSILQKIEDSKVNLSRLN